MRRTSIPLALLLVIVLLAYGVAVCWPYPTSGAIVPPPMFGNCDARWFDGEWQHQRAIYRTTTDSAVMLELSDGKLIIASGFAIVRDAEPK